MMIPKPAGHWLISPNRSYRQSFRLSSYRRVMHQANALKVNRGIIRRAAKLGLQAVAHNDCILIAKLSRLTCAEQTSG